MAISSAGNKALERNWSISEIAKGIQWSSIVIGRGGRVSPGEIIFFMDQLSLMLETGTPVNKSIQAISFQIKNKTFKNILKEIEQDIEEGRLLSDAMTKHPHIFSNVYTSMIRAGESGGFLKEMLERIVALEEKQQKLLATVRAALFYPAFLTLFAVSVVLFIVVYVFPKFGDMFAEIYDSLPFTTKILMAASHLLTSYWYLILFFIGMSWFTAYRFMITDKGRMYIDLLKLRLPLFRNFFMRVYISRLMRTLGLLISSNVSILDSLTISAGAIGNKVFSKLIDKIRRSVEDGKPLSQPIIDSPFFPETVKQMIRTGEDTGTLHKVMPRLADYYDEEIEKHVQRITTIMEPILLVVVGGIIGVIVISLILPIFKLTKSIH